MNRACGSCPLARRARIPGVKGAGLVALGLTLAKCSLGFGEHFSGGAEAADASADAPGTIAEGGGPTPTPADAGTDGDGAAIDDVTRGLLVHYRLDETMGIAVLDSAAGKNDGELRSGDAGIPERVAGIRMGALSFAAGSHVQVPFHPSMEIGPSFSVTMWLRAPAAAGFQARLLTYGGSFDIKLNGRNPQLSLGGQYAAANYQLPTDRWTHLAVVFTGGRASWFVDAFATQNQTDTFDGTKVPGPLGAPVLLATNALSHYTGQLDDVRVYSVALTAEEIAVLAKK